MQRVPGRAQALAARAQAARRRCRGAPHPLRSSPAPTRRQCTALLLRIQMLAALARARAGRRRGAQPSPRSSSAPHDAGHCACLGACGCSAPCGGACSRSPWPGPGTPQQERGGGDVQPFRLQHSRSARPHDERTRRLRGPAENNQTEGPSLTASAASGGALIAVARSAPQTSGNVSRQTSVQTHSRRQIDGCSGTIGPRTWCAPSHRRRVAACGGMCISVPVACGVLV